MNISAKQAKDFILNCSIECNRTDISVVEPLNLSFHAVHTLPNWKYNELELRNIRLNLLQGKCQSINADEAIICMISPELDI